MIEDERRLVTMEPADHVLMLWQSPRFAYESTGSSWFDYQDAVTHDGRSTPFTLRKELLMPTGLVWIGGILVVAAGGLIFLFLRRLKAAELPHFR